MNPNAIGFKWDIGYVRIILENSRGKTMLTLEERLPFEFKNIPRDFSGWQFQVRNIKHISETGQPQDMNQVDFKEIEAQVAAEMDIK